MLLKWYLSDDATYCDVRSPTAVCDNATIYRSERQWDSYSMIHVSCGKANSFDVLKTLMYHCLTIPRLHFKMYILNRLLNRSKLECGPMPNVMAALPTTGTAFYSTPQFCWLTPTTSARCSNAAKTRNPLKFARVPQTRQQISAVSRPKFTILWGHVEKVSMFNKFFFRLSIHALAAKIQPDKVVRWCQNGDFLRPVFTASLVPHISHLHSRFALALRPHHVWKYGRHPISDRWN